MTLFSGQVRIRLTSQLIKDISRVLQKLFKCFNDTSIFIFKIHALLVLSNNLDFNLNDSESAIGFSGTSLQNYYKVPDNSDHVPLNYTLALQNQDRLHYLFACYLFH